MVCMGMINVPVGVLLEYGINSSFTFSFEQVWINLYGVNFKSIRGVILKRGGG